MKRVCNIYHVVSSWYAIFDCFGKMVHLFAMRRANRLLFGGVYSFAYVLLYFVCHCTTMAMALLSVSAVRVRSSYGFSNVHEIQITHIALIEMKTDEIWWQNGNENPQSKAKNNYTTLQLPTAAQQQLPHYPLTTTATATTHKKLKQKDKITIETKTNT